MIDHVLVLQRTTQNDPLRVVGRVSLRCCTSMHCFIAFFPLPSPCTSLAYATKMAQNHSTSSNSLTTSTPCRPTITVLVRYDRAPETTGVYIIGAA